MFHKSIRTLLKYVFLWHTHCDLLDRLHLVDNTRMTRIKMPESYSCTALRRRRFLSCSLGAMGGLALAGLGSRPKSCFGQGAERDPSWTSATQRGLDYLARTQASRGQWNTPPYPVALSALAGLACCAQVQLLPKAPTPTTSRERRIICSARAARMV